MADGVGKTGGNAQGATIRGAEFASTMQNAQNEGPSEHIVVRGDTMSKIARQHKVQLNDLVGANPQFQQGRSAHRIYVGEHIQLPRTGGAPQSRVHDTIPASHEPASKQAKLEPGAKQASSETTPKHSNAELKQMWQHAKSEGLHVSFSQYKEMQKIYEGEGDKSAKPVVAEKAPEKLADKPAEQKTGNAGLITQEKAATVDKDWNAKDSHFMPPTVVNEPKTNSMKEYGEWAEKQKTGGGEPTTAKTEAPKDSGKPDAKPAEKKGDDPVISVTARAGYTEGSTRSGDDTRGTSETLNVTTPKPIPLTDDKKLSLKPSIEASAVQSEAINSKGEVKDTSYKQVAGKLDLNYKATEQTTVYAEAYGEVNYNETGSHPADSPMGADSATVIGGAGVKHSEKLTKEVTLDVNPRVRVTHSENFNKPGQDGITNTVRPGLITSLSYKPESVPGLKMSLDSYAEVRHDFERDTSKGVVAFGPSATYSVNPNVDLSLKGQYGIGGTTISPDGTIAPGDGNKDAFAIFGGVSVKF